MTKCVFNVKCTIEMMVHTVEVVTNLVIFLCVAHVIHVGGGPAPLPHCSTTAVSFLLSYFLSHPLQHGQHIEMRVCSQGTRVDHTPLAGGRQLELRRGERRKKGR